ncbi:hypothetical protein ACP70R_030462 [Stipagrostis hirtigluma subsp. patula]
MVATGSTWSGKEGGRSSEKEHESGDGGYVGGGCDSAKGGNRGDGASGGKRPRRGSSPSTCSETEVSRSNSPVESASEIPPSLEEDDWGGIAVGTGLRCRHGLRPRRKVCWAGKNTGRRFLGCSLEEDEDQCHFVQWCDEEWPERAQRYLVELWKVIGAFQRMEEEARREMRQAVQEKEEQLRRNREEVEQAKAIAQRACLFYETRASSEADEKKRAWMIAAILGGLLVAMVFGLLVKKK